MERPFRWFRKTYETWIRKCPKCGTVNGTRGNSCKNKACDVVFRNNGASKKTSTEACKLTLNIPGLQIFSVRLRDRGPDYRNFVQLPLSPVSDEKQEANPYSQCYVDTCRRNKVVSLHPLSVMLIMLMLNEVLKETNDRCNWYN
ncbi:hypothetical protein Ocin01_18283, partial [Orchesella cincta]